MSYYILLPYVLYFIRFYRTSACVYRMSENCMSLVMQDKCNIEIFLSPGQVLVHYTVIALDFRNEILFKLTLGI